MTVSTISSELLIIFGSKLSLVVHHHKPKALQKDWIVVIPDLASVKSLLINSLYKNKWLSITVDSEKASLWISITVDSQKYMHNSPPTHLKHLLTLSPSFYS